MSNNSFKKYIFPKFASNDKAARDNDYVKSKNFSSHVQDPIENSAEEMALKSGQMKTSGWAESNQSAGEKNSNQAENAKRKSFADALLSAYTDTPYINDANFDRAAMERMADEGPVQHKHNAKIGDVQVSSAKQSPISAAESAKFDRIAVERMCYEGADQDNILHNSNLVGRKVNEPGSHSMTKPTSSMTDAASSMTNSNSVKTETPTTQTETEKSDAQREIDRMAESMAKKTAQARSGARPLTQKSVAANAMSGNKTSQAGLPARPRLIAIANQKGGVGKTTTAINLATALCAVGKKVLLMDLDPQGNASTGLGVRRSAIRTSVYDVLFDDANIVEASVPTRVPGLSVLPSSIHLSGAEIELVTAENREYRLKKALHQNLPYDYVIVDCPPSLNLLTLNALVAMDSILVPLQCEFYALEGLSHLVKTIERVQKSFNPGLDIHGVVLTMYDARNKLSAMVEEDVRAHFGDKVYKTIIPRNVRLSEAPSHGLPAIIYDMKCSGAQAYIQLAREVIQRERNIAQAANESGNDGSAQVA